MHKILVCFAMIMLFHARSSSSFSIDLIHRDSPLSPLFNNSLTPSELLRRSIKRSITRINNFETQIEGKSIESVVISNGGSYLMKFSIGTPPVEVLATADTGSDLIWVQCLPCAQCYRQNSPPFDPTKSSTYQRISCVSDPCQALPRRFCGNTNECQYYYSYGDKSYTRGDLTTDTFTFKTSDAQLASFPTSVFGCGHDNGGKFNSRVAGLVGLGNGPLSLVRQLSNQINNKFSYCLVPLSASATSKLRFGEEAVISGQGVVSTPFVTKSPPTFYFLTLRGISVGGKTVQSDQSEGNIIIDSGTTLTLLEYNTYNNLEATVREAVGGQPVQDPTGTLNLCYEMQPAMNVPNMVFHFAGADLLLKPLNTFINYNGLYCLAFAPSDSLSIFGNVAQVNFQVEYDLQGEQVSFAPADCTVQ